jgi:hypothetical protein
MRPCPALALLALCAGAPALGQQTLSAPDDARQVQDFEVEADDSLGFDELSGSQLKSLDAFAALRSGEPIRARELAQELLREDPESIPGHVLLGSVLYESEGDLARARHVLRNGKALFERKYGRTGEAGDDQLWHAEALSLLSQVTGEMGEDEEALAIQAEFEAIYPQEQPAWSAWQLMRLGRFNEARRIARYYLRHGRSPNARDAARAALCAIEAESLDREGAYEACVVNGAYASRAEGGDSSVAWSNAAEAAWVDLRLGEVESLLLESTKHGPQDFGNPWADLVHLYTAQGRLAEASAALREMVAWREGQVANVRAQSWARADLAAGALLLVAGRSEDAERLLTRALAAPDRHGATNEEPAQRVGGAALLLAATLRTRAEEAREEASWAAWWQAPWHRLRALWLDGRAWLAQRQVVDALAHPRFLQSTLRPHMVDQLILPLSEWAQSDVVRLLGAGVADAAIDAASRAERHALAAGYFAALRVEVAALRGDDAAVAELARQSVLDLPESEVLLRARVSALHGESAREAGDIARSAAAYDLALQRDPGVIRRLGLTLPASFAASGGDLAEDAADHLRDSPRFAEEEGAFRVQVSQDGASGRACLLGVNSEVLACARVEPRAGEPESARARRLAQEFHEAVFAARISLSQVDLRSLDGSPLAGGRGAVDLGVGEWLRAKPNAPKAP